MSIRNNSIESSTVYLKKAFMLFNQGRFDRAEKVLRKLRKDFPLWFEPQRLSGLNALYQGKSKSAVKFLEKALTLGSETAEILDWLGTALMECEQFDRAKIMYQKSLTLKPEDAGVYNNLGNAYRKLGLLNEARDAYFSSLKIEPEKELTKTNLANVFHDLECYSDAEKIYRAILAGGGDNPGLYANLISALLFQKKIREGLEICDQGLNKFPDNALLLFNKGHLLGATGDLEESEKTLMKLLKIEPGHAKALQALSIHFFLQGRWREAWNAYEARFLTGNVVPRPFRQKTWEGEPLQGRKILVWGEQGAGDEIMFASMIPDLLSKGAEIYFEADPRLVPLFERSFRGVKFLERRDPPEKITKKGTINFQSSSGSLGRWFRNNQSQFPGGEPFLRADKNYSKILRQRYKKEMKLLVGISWWSSNPDIGSEKSIDLLELQPLFEIEGVQFINLQYGDTAEQREVFFSKTGFQLLHDDEINQLNSLDDFASQVSAMDLVISISNTTVHMAGGLGIPVWVMLQRTPDRRWMMDRFDSPWYKSVRLFRQQGPNNWTPVIRSVHGELKTYAKMAAVLKTK